MQQGVVPQGCGAWDAAVESALVVAPDVQHAAALQAPAALARQAQQSAQGVPPDVPQVRLFMHQPQP